VISPSALLVYFIIWIELIQCCLLLFTLLPGDTLWVAGGVSLSTVSRGFQA